MTDRHIKCGDTMRVISTGHIGRVSSITAFGEYCKVGYEDGIRLHNYPMPFHRDELEHVEALPTNHFQAGDLVVPKNYIPGCKIQVYRIESVCNDSVYTVCNTRLPKSAILLYHRPEPTPTPSPADTIISAFNDMEKEIAGLRAELADLNKQLLRSRAETQHAIAIHEHYKIFHPVH